MHQPIDSLANEVVERLMALKWKIVFAESCTGGLISATLARIPGVSNVHCGSAVVYRLDTKTRWLGVPSSLLIEPGPVSEVVARLMAEGVLRQTPEAEIAVSITGHLGPNAPEPQDGQIFVAVAIRGGTCQIVEHRLAKYTDANSFHYPGDTERDQRQWEAVSFVLTRVVNALREIEQGHAAATT